MAARVFISHHGFRQVQVQTGQSAVRRAVFRHRYRSRNAVQIRGAVHASQVSVRERAFVVVVFLVYVLLVSLSGVRNNGAGWLFSLYESPLLALSMSCALCPTPFAQQHLKLLGPPNSGRSGVTQCTQGFSPSPRGDSTLQYL